MSGSSTIGLQFNLCFLSSLPFLIIFVKCRNLQAHRNSQGLLARAPARSPDSLEALSLCTLGRLSIPAGLASPCGSRSPHARNLARVAPSTCSEEFCSRFLRLFAYIFRQKVARHYDSYLVVILVIIWKLRRRRRRVFEPEVPRVETVRRENYVRRRRLGFGLGRRGRPRVRKGRGQERA